MQNNVFAGPSDDIPVKVSGNVKSGFEAEFEPRESGVHTVLVEYNGVAVGGTPFYSKVTYMTGRKGGPQVA